MAVEHIMSVPKVEILRREAEYKKMADANPNRMPRARRPIEDAIKETMIFPMTPVPET